MTAQIIRGDALHLPLADESVDLVVTSPPYFGLRSYSDNGEHYEGQLGAEATPAEYVDALIAATREMVRVLKPSGSIFVNLGDKYNAYNGGRGPGTLQDNAPRQSVPRGNGLDVKGVRPKSLLLIPHRYAIRCVDELGLILRAEVIWSKPNGLPESVTDRVRRSHEQWFHFTREPRYYSAVDEIREAHDQSYAQRRFTPSPPKAKGNDDRNGGWSGVLRAEKQVTGNPLGKLPGSVWEIPTQPLRVPAHLGVDHFAAFPMELPRRIITAWSPRDVCTGCGEGRRPVAERATALRHNNGRHGPTGLTPDNNHGKGASTLDIVPDYRITGYACACPDTTAPTTPGVCLDPFGGTGTTALVASVLGRHGITVDMSSDYCRLAEWRCNDPGERARAMQVDKPTVQVDGQEALFEVGAT